MFLQEMALSWGELLVQMAAIIVGAVVALIIGLFGPQSLEAWRKRRESILAQKNILLISKVSSFNPAGIVAAYRIFQDYLPIEADEEIRKALEERCNIILVGRPHIGKSRAAVYHIEKIFPKGWQVLQPLPGILDHLSKITISRRQYILLLDDVDELLGPDNTGGGTLLAFVNLLRSQAKELVVIATARSTSPEYDNLGISKLAGKWRTIAIQDWSDDKGEQLAFRLNIDFKSCNDWDGTPLSLIQPSPLMKAMYERAPAAEKRALRGLLLLKSCGLEYVPRQLFVQVCRLRHFGYPDDVEVNESIIEGIDRKGFLRRADDWVQAYGAYLDLIDDWRFRTEMSDSLESVLDDKLWTKQLVAHGAFTAKSGDFASLQRAERIYAKAVVLEPDIEAYHYRLGIVLARLDRWPEASDRLQKAIEIMPSWTTAWYRLAEAYRKQGRINESREAFKKGRQFGSTDPNIRHQNAESLRLEARYEDALEEYSEVLRLDPKNAQAWYGYGRTLRTLSKWPEAVDAYKNAIELRENFAEAYFGLAEPLQAMGDLAGAEKAYREALAGNSKLCDVYTYLSKLLEENGDTEEAKRILHEGLEQCPREPRIPSYLAELLSNEGRLEEAIERYEQAINLKEDYSEALIGLARSQRKLAKKTRNSSLFDEATRNNLRAVQLNEKNPWGHFGLGMCYFDMRQWNDAIHSFRNALIYDGNMHPALYRSAVALRRAGAPINDVMECLSKCRRITSEPKDLVALDLEEAKLCCENGMCSKALDILQNIKKVTNRKLDARISKDPAFANLRSNPVFWDFFEKSIQLT